MSKAVCPVCGQTYDEEDMTIADNGNFCSALLLQK